LKYFVLGEGGRQKGITAQSAACKRVEITDLSEEVFENLEVLDSGEGEAVIKLIIVRRKEK